MSANRSRNAAGDSAYPYLQAGPQAGYAHPSQRRSPGVHPAQPDSSPQLSHHRRFTVPAAPTQEHAFYSPAPASAPASTPLSGSDSYYPPHPVSASPTRYASTDFSGPLPHGMQRAVKMPMPVHSDTAPPMPYNTPPPNTTYSPSHSQLSGGSQPTGTYPNWNSPEVNAREGDPSYFSGGVSERGSEEETGLPKGPTIFPFARHKRQGGGSSSSPLNQVACALCETLSTWVEIERLSGFCTELCRWNAGYRRCRSCETWSPPDRWDGFCSETHRWNAGYRRCRACETWSPPEVINRWGGFCSEIHRWDAGYCRYRSCETWIPPEVINRWGGFCSESHRWNAGYRRCRSCETWSPPEVINRLDGFCSEIHRWEASQRRR